MTKRSNDPWAVQGKLTQALVGRLLAAPPAKGNRRRPHGEVDGFGLVVTHAGAGSYYFRYRREGIERLYVIGDAKAWPLAAAEKECRSLRHRVDSGGDPAAERKGRRDAPTIADLAERYKSGHLQDLRPSSAREYTAIIDKLILPELRNIKVAALRHADVQRLHRKIAARAPYRANRAVAVLSKMLSLAAKWEWRSGDNPCKGIERAQEEKREKFLSPQEIARLSEALNNHPEKISANAIRLLLLTGARRGETLSATWDQFDVAGGVWTKPSHATKQAKTHRVPLSTPALALLNGMRAEAGPNAQYLFPSGNGHLTEIKKSWASLCRIVDITGTRVHDLRHSYASVLVSAGLSLPIIGALLGHTQAATTQRYAHLFDDALRAATERAGQIISSAVQPSAEVVPLQRR
jgi:integrase